MSKRSKLIYIIYKTWNQYLALGPINILKAILVCIKGGNCIENDMSLIEDSLKGFVDIFDLKEGVQIFF